MNIETDFRHIGAQKKGHGLLKTTSLNKIYYLENTNAICNYADILDIQKTIGLKGTLKEAKLIL